MLIFLTFDAILIRNAVGIGTHNNAFFKILLYSELADALSEQCNAFGTVVKKVSRTDNVTANNYEPLSLHLFYHTNLDVRAFPGKYRAIHLLSTGDLSREIPSKHMSTSFLSSAHMCAKQFVFISRYLTGDGSAHLESYSIDNSSEHQENFLTCLNLQISLSKLFVYIFYN